METGVESVVSKTVDKKVLRKAVYDDYRTATEAPIPLPVYESLLSFFDNFLTPKNEEILLVDVITPNEVKAVVDYFGEENIDALVITTPRQKYRRRINKYLKNIDISYKKIIVLRGKEFYKKNWEDIVFSHWGNMKRFIILGNPPYTDGTGGRANIWPKILKKCMVLTDNYVGMVIPKTCALGNHAGNKEARRLLLDNGLQILKFVDKNAFPAKIGIVFVICNLKTKDSTPIIYSETNETYIYDNEDAFFGNFIIKDIITKIAAKVGKQYYRSNDRYKLTTVKARSKKVSEKTLCVTLVNPKGKETEWTEYTNPQIKNIWKVVNSYLNNSSRGWHLECFWPVDKGTDIIEGYTYISAETKQDMNRIGSYLRTAFCNVIWYYTRTSRSLDTPQIGYIPMIGHLQDWTDKKLFDYFDLNEKERKFILSEFKKQIPSGVH